MALKTKPYTQILTKSNSASNVKMQECLVDDIFVELGNAFLQTIILEHIVRSPWSVCSYIRMKPDFYKHYYRKKKLHFRYTDLSYLNNPSFKYTLI